MYHSDSSTCIYPIKGMSTTSGPLVHLHQIPQSGIKNNSTATIKAISTAVACDDCDATTSPLSRTEDLADNIDDTVDITCLTRNITSADSYITSLSSPSTAPTTPTTPSTPVAGIIGMEGFDIYDTKPSDSGTPCNATNPDAQGAKKSRSRASSTSQRAKTRSASSSTAGNSSTRRPGQHRRTMSSQQVPTAPGLQSRGSTSSNSNNNNTQMTPQKRDQLLALHRDSCRLFQDGVNNSNSNGSMILASDPLNLAQEEALSTRSAFVSPTASPILQTQRSHSFPVGFSGAVDDQNISDEDLLPSSSSSISNRRYYRATTTRTISHIHPEGISPVPESHEALEQHEQQEDYFTEAQVPPAAVVEWTSPTTRRREYEKIDRSNKGIRRIWRRLTPSCFHSSNTRTPFFEEGRKKTNEGSVRRFRMDIPDDVNDSNTENEKGGQIQTRTQPSRNDTGLLSGPKPDKMKWSCF